VDIEEAQKYLKELRELKIELSDASIKIEKALRKKSRE